MWNVVTIEPTQFVVCKNAVYALTPLNKDSDVSLGSVAPLAVRKNGNVVKGFGSNVRPLHNIEAYEIIVGFLCQCRKEKNLDMYVMFNRKRKYLMRELL